MGALTKVRFAAALPSKAPVEVLRGPVKFREATGVLPVYEVAEKSGFRSPYHFSDSFRKELGQTPLQYRKGGA